jgi:rod shape-determining protein MreB
MNSPLGEFPSTSIAFQRAIKNGRVQSSHFVRRLLSEAFQELDASKFFGKGRFAIASISESASDNEAFALKKGISAAGAWSVRLTDKGHAAWRGCARQHDIPFVLDLGAETTELIGVVGELKTQAQVAFGGKKLDRAIQEYCLRERQAEISLEQAETIKIDLGTLKTVSEPGATNWISRNPDGKPSRLQLTSEEIRPCLNQSLEEMAAAVRELLSQAPEEIVSAVVEKGIMLCGGTSLLQGISEVFSQTMGVKVSLAEKPFDAVALGCLQRVKS